jgi:hypothetical protein
MAKRKYTDEQKATYLAILDGHGGNLARTARETGVPRKTLADWSAGRGATPGVTDIRHQKKAALAEMLEQLAGRLLALTTDNDIRAVDLGGRFKALAIAVDKMRLLREQPTDIGRRAIESMSDDDQTIAKYTAALVELVAEETAKDS